ncbi:hypothetical protein HPB50_025823 [Hyalomma asiaticum]|uniref:Uncharacterized protein n=1 Tax=Hyalomma asiaticum TaxID=266040 RepID=A0ACB7SVK2_HYAAI|nr:hypothetical protein HPB50_025823 [Hyalomma asiaticum]
MHRRLRIREDSRRNMSARCRPGPCSVYSSSHDPTHPPSISRRCDSPTRDSYEFGRRRQQTPDVSAWFTYPQVSAHFFFSAGTPKREQASGGLRRWQPLLVARLSADATPNPICASALDKTLPSRVLTSSEKHETIADASAQAITPPTMPPVRSRETRRTR